VLESLGQHEETHHEKGDYGRVRDTRWRDAGTGRAEGRSDGRFDLGGWVVPYADEVFGREIDELFGEPFDRLLGRKTYEIFAAHWPMPEAGRTIPSPEPSTASPNTSLLALAMSTRAGRARSC
jgi:hypothetical protein